MLLQLYERTRIKKNGNISYRKRLKGKSRSRVHYLRVYYLSCYVPRVFGRTKKISDERRVVTYEKPDGKLIPIVRIRTKEVEKSAVVWPKLGRKVYRKLLIYCWPKIFVRTHVFVCPQTLCVFVQKKKIKHARMKHPNS